MFIGNIAVVRRFKVKVSNSEKRSQTAHQKDEKDAWAGAGARRGTLRK